MFTYIYIYVYLYNACVYVYNMYTSHLAECAARPCPVAGGARTAIRKVHRALTLI